MSALPDKIRRARESTVEVGGFGFTIRRPTDVDLMEMRGKGPADWMRFVVGWEKVRELDILRGGDPHPLPCDAAACVEWLRDRPDLLGAIFEAIMAACQAHRDKQDAAEKN